MYLHSYIFPKRQHKNARWPKSLLNLSLNNNREYILPGDKPFCYWSSWGLQRQPELFKPWGPLCPHHLWAFPALESGLSIIKFSIWCLLVGRPHSQSQSDLTIIFLQHIIQGRVCDSWVLGRVCQGRNKVCSIISGSAFLDFLDHIFILKGRVFPDFFAWWHDHDDDDGHDDNCDHILCRDLTIFSVASEARTWLPGLEQVLQAHNDLPDKVVESPLYGGGRFF